MVQVADGNKSMISLVKNTIQEKLSQALGSYRDWDRFLDHCYYFSTETMA